MNTFKIFVFSIFVFLHASAALAADGLIVFKSPHSVTATADRLESTLSENGMKIMNRINHAAGAKAADMELRPTELVIFGNPKVGTPLMQCAQSVAVDLPQKALIWEDENGQVWLGYNDPQYLRVRHAIEGCDEVLAKVGEALNSFARAAIADN